MKKQFFTLLLVVFSLLSSATAWGQVCKIGAISFDKLEDALAYVNSYPDQEMTIIMLTDYTLPAGTYTLPAKATLVVPKSDEQETGFPKVEYIPYISTPQNEENKWKRPEEFLRLTFAKGVNMNVYGTIELSGKLHASSEDYTSSPYGPYGLLHMNEGAKMTLMDGSELRAWGFMTGQGETDARRGSTVREIFQMGDWKGGKISKMLLGSDKGVFPITQYYIQNIESPVKYQPGAKLSTMAAVSVDLGGGTSLTAEADVAIIGVSGTDEAMFLMDNEADQENTWVRKWYNDSTDQQTYEVNSGAHIGSIVIDLGEFIEGLKMNSSVFVLPLTNNMKIHLLSGMMDFTQNTALLPGAEVEINKESVVSITKNKDANVKSGSLYIYDADQWGKYAYAKDGYKYTKVVRYTPSASTADGQPTVRNEDVCPDDASINVHGTFDTNDGYIFTSVRDSIDEGGNKIEIGGANIFSTNEDAGTFVFTTEATTDTVQVWQINEEGKEVAETFVSAKLINNDLSYTETAGTEILSSYCYMDNKWSQLDYVNCYTIDGDIFSETPVVNAVYAKPQEYVEIAFNGIDMAKGEFIGNPDHTFSDKATGNRRFILMNNNCQWWEVESVEGEDGLFHCIHPLNNTYYYWEEGDEENGENGEWVEKRYTITWKNGKDTIDTYQLPRGAMAEYLGTNPTKPMDKGYTYTFTGWDPALAPVTDTATYTAVYAETPRKYTITLESDVEGACSFTGAGAYDYNTTATISATMNPDYQFVGWVHDETLDELSFITTVKGDVTYTVLAEPAATIIRDGLTAGNYYTICMPKAMTNVQGATLWSFCGKDANFAYLVQEDAPYTAGKAYIMYAEAETVSAILTGEPAPAPVANGAIHGTFADMYQAALDAAGDNIYLVIGNELRRVDGQTGNRLPANRAYVDIDKIATGGVPAGIPANRVRSMPMQPQVATGMENVDASAHPVKTIINGQLFILRGEKMYDAQGQLIK